MRITYTSPYPYSLFLIPVKSVMIYQRLIWSKMFTVQLVFHFHSLDATETRRKLKLSENTRTTKSIKSSLFI